MTAREATPDVWVYDLERGTWTRLTHGPASEFNPEWTADGRRVIFDSEQPVFQLFWKPADGASPEQLLSGGSYDRYPTSLSPDGKVLAYTENHPQTGLDLWVLPLDGEGKPEPLLKTPFAENLAVFSPDGRFLAYQSNESGRFEIYVRNYRGPEGRWQVSTDGGDSPLWARSGRELFYRQRDKMIAVPLNTANGCSAGKPVVLFQGEYETLEINRGYDVTPDGQRFIMVRREESAVPPRVHVVLNWFEELKRRVPSGKK